MFRILLPLCAAVIGWPASAEPATSTGTHPVSTSTGQSAQVLTLSVAIEMAFSANPELSSARQELAATDAGVMQASALPNPSVDIGVEDTRSATRETTLLFNQPLEIGGKRAARTRAAERGRDVASADMAAKRVEVRASVIGAFFDVVAAQERLQLAQQSAELASRATTAATRRVAAGKVSPVEETKARVAESGVKLEAAQARSELVIARKRLAATWGGVTMPFDRADGALTTLPALPDAEQFALRLQHSPVLLRARHEADRFQALSQLERARRIPDVTVSLGVKRSEEQGRNLALIGVSMPLPLFDTNRGNVLESQRRADKARDELAGTALRLDSELTQAWEKLDLSRQEAMSLRDDILPGAQSAYDAATRGFEYGKFAFLDVLDAQRTLLQARAQYLRALADAQRAAADIDRILGDATSNISMNSSQP